MTRPTSLPVSEIRKKLSEVLTRVAYGGEKITVTRSGRPIAVIGPAPTVKGRKV